MKIGILTLPLTSNYGGILQNYALQTVLKRERFEVYTMRSNPPISKMKIAASVLKRSFAKYIFRKNVILRILPTKKEFAIINQNIDRFIKENITQTKKFYKNKFRLIKKYKFNACIVGSDQVWRPGYSPCLTNYFFDFLDRNNKVKKIAYAASFGVDKWKFTKAQTKKCSVLAKQFDAISVREDSAIRLCRDYFNVEAIQVLDPTMLLKKEDYINLIKQDNIPERENILFSYVLNRSDEKDIFIQKATKEFNLQHIAGTPLNSFNRMKSKNNLSDCIFLPVTEWMAGFRDAKFIVTDSFHGTAFAILFNKPFVLFANEGRGNTRLISLLRMFKLEDRLITNSNFDSQLYYLDYSEINNIIEKERDKSISFLLKALQ